MMAKSEHTTPDGAVRPGFARALGSLAEILGVTLTEGRIRGYALALGDVPMEDVNRGLLLCLQTRRTGQGNPVFPSPGDIRAYIEPVGDDAALAAWTHLNKMVRQHGSYVAVRIEDGAAADALADVFGSWPAFCALEEGPALEMRRREFVAAYKRYAVARAQSARVLPGLLGGVTAVQRRIGGRKDDDA